MRVVSLMWERCKLRDTSSPLTHGVFRPFNTGTSSSNVASYRVVNPGLPGCLNGAAGRAMESRGHRPPWVKARSDRVPRSPYSWGLVTWVLPFWIKVGAVTELIFLLLSSTAARLSMTWLSIQVLWPCWSFSYWRCVKESLELSQGCMFGPYHATVGDLWHDKALIRLWSWSWCCLCPFPRDPFSWGFSSPSFPSSFTVPCLARETATSFHLRLSDPLLNHEASCKVGLLTSSPRPPFPGLFCILQSKVFDLQTSLWLSLNHGAFVKLFGRFSMNLASWELRFVEWYKKVSHIIF